MERLFAVSAPGLEPYTAQELEHLGLGRHQAAPQEIDGGSLEEDAGGIEFEGSLLDLYRANLQLRTATRLLVRLGEFYAAAFSELRKKSSRLPWERYLTPGRAVALRVTCHKSRLYHSKAVAERVVGAICDRLGEEVRQEKLDENAPGPHPQLIVVRLMKDLCTISVDSSGEALHRRGYRKATAKAPLRETLAAGILLASGWDGVSPLVDPFCGSGTIPIEAALMARKLAPGRNRRFAFMSWPDFDLEKWEAVLAGVQAQANGVPMPPILASDRDAGAIIAARGNAARAGVADAIQFTCQSVSAIDPSGTGWLVTNPPYGQRVSSNKDLRNLYAQLGNVLRVKCSGWQVAILCSDDRLLNSTGLHLERSVSLTNGGTKVRLGRGQVG